MAWELAIAKLPGLKAGADLSAKQYYFVTLNSNGDVVENTVVGGIVIGVLQNKPKSGEAAEVMMIGITPVIASAAITKGDKIVAAGTAGKAKTAAGVLQGSATWDPGSLLDGAGETSASITVTGAALGDFVVISAPYDLQGLIAHGYVDAANSVKIRLQNESGGTVDLGSGTWRVKVFPQGQIGGGSIGAEVVGVALETAAADGDKITAIVNCGTGVA